MLEVTVKGSDGRPQSFRFENDSLQAFLTEEAGLGHGVEVVSLSALGVPIAQPEPAKPAAKTAGPGAARAAATPTSAPKPPVGSTPAKPATPETK